MSPREMIIDAFRSQSYVANQIDVQHTPLYDTFVVAAAANLLSNTTTFFDNVGSASGKTLAQTNMETSRRLQSPEAFSIFAIRFFFAGDILLADAVAILRNFALELYLGSKVYQRAPLWHYACGGGITGLAATTVTSTTITHYTNGVPSREAMHKLAIPLVIENGMNFYARLVGTASVTMTAAGAGGTGATLVCLLDGLYARGVQ